MQVVQLEGMDRLMEVEVEAEVVVGTDCMNPTQRMAEAEVEVVGTDCTTH
jgi:hypothetical protein